MNQSLHTLTIFLRGSVQAVNLQYETADKAARQADLAMAPYSSSPEMGVTRTLLDDFGRAFTFDRNDVSWVMRESMDKAMAGNIAANLANMRLQAGVQKAVMTDSELQAAARMLALAQAGQGMVRA